MLQNLKQRLAETWQQLGMSQLLDVLVVALFAYAVIAWFRSARTRFVAIGAAFLAVLYGVAQVLNLYLTQWLFKVGLTVALVTLVIIFQDDIRRAFERLAATFLRSERRTADQSLVELLVSSCEVMAKERTGALLVLPGRDPIDRHVTGGVALEGKPSVPLLLSLFDHRTPGHDGAMLIEGGHITHFAAHLPLSTNIHGGEHFGTRHTAAMGLTERTDALVIVVSEERGEISVAQAGTLKPVASSAELAQYLEAHLGHSTANTLGLRLKEVILGRPWAKLASLGIAVLTWIIVFGVQGEVMARTFEVPIEYRDIPEGWILDEPDPVKASITLSGTQRAFRVLNPSSLVVSLDVGHLRPGRQQVPIGDDDLVRPSDLTVHRIEPSQVLLVAHETREINVPIVPKTVGKLPAGKRLGKITVEPAKVKILVRKESVGRVRSIRTEPLDLEAIFDTREIKVGFELPSGSRLGKGSPDEATATVRVR